MYTYSICEMQLHVENDKEKEREREREGNRKIMKYEGRKRNHTSIDI